LSVCLVIFLGVATMTRASVWGVPALHIFSEVVNHPLSPRANYGMGKQYAIYASRLTDSVQKSDALDEAEYYFEKSSVLRKSYTDGLFGLLLMEGIEGRTMSEQSFQELLARLKDSPFSNNSYNYLNSVFDCLERGDCRLSREKVTGIIDACIKNSGFSGKHKIAIMRRYQEYLR